jgi:hypothetical protein
MSESISTTKQYKIWLCNGCIDGVGEMCHVPECALCRHSVDIPIGREMLELVDDSTLVRAEREACAELIRAWCRANGWHEHFVEDLLQEVCHRDEAIRQRGGNSG